MTTIASVKCSVVDMGVTRFIWPNTSVYPSSKKRDYLLKRIAQAVGGRVVGSVVIAPAMPLVK